MKSNPTVFIVSAAIILTFVILGAVFPTTLGDLFTSIQSIIVTHVGWFYIVSVGFFVIFVFWLLFSRYGSVKLGQDDDEPEFSRFTWFAMLFSAGMGIGLLFYSVAEPVMHFDNPPRVESGGDLVPQIREHRAEFNELQSQLAQSPDNKELEQQVADAKTQLQAEENRAIPAAREAMRLTFFHWGIHAWAIYIVVGLSLAYFSFRHGLPLTIRSTLYPIFGERIHGPAGYTVDILAVIGTLFGVATSLGLGASQIAAGLHHIDVIKTDPSNTEGFPLAEVVIIAVITAIATISVVTGLKVGIRRLSEMNLVLGLALVLFVFIAGPTVFLLSSFVQSVGVYVTSLVELTFHTDAFRGEGWGQEWQKSWTMFYWGWWISWSPFVGMFIARVSRGRTIREFILGALLAPTLLTFLWIIIFGNTAIHMEIFGNGGIIAAVDANVATAMFVMLENLPVWPLLTGLMSVVTMVVIATYFVTSSDSASLVIDILTSNGDPDPPVITRVFWALTEGAVAAILLIAGGLAALQTGAITTAVPVCIIMLLICWSLTTGLRRSRYWTETRELIRQRRLGMQDELTAAADRIPETGAAAVGLDPTEVAEDGETEDRPWRPRLQHIIESERRAARAAKTPEVEQVRTQIDQFLDTTVIPAFKEIHSELRKQGRDARIDKQPYQALLTVLHRNEEEFSYAVRARAYYKLSFAFPQMEPTDEPRTIRAEVVLPDGPRPERHLRAFTKQSIIKSFLEEYARWREV